MKRAYSKPRVIRHLSITTICLIRPLRSGFLLQLTGCVLLGVSIWILVDKDAWSYLRVATLGDSEDLVKAAAITLCVVGGAVFLIAFLGCCGAMKENVCMLNTVCMSATDSKRKY